MRSFNLTGSHSLPLQIHVSPRSFGINGALRSSAFTIREREILEWKKLQYRGEAPFRGEGGGSPWTRTPSGKLGQNAEWEKRPIARGRERRVGKEGRWPVGENAEWKKKGGSPWARTPSGKRRAAARGRERRVGKLEPPMGVEPTTPSLRMMCSTN